MSKVGQYSNGLNSKELYMSLEIKKKKIFFPCVQVLYKTYTIWQFHTVVGIDGKLITGLLIKQGTGSREQEKERENEKWE